MAGRLSPVLALSIFFLPAWSRADAPDPVRAAIDKGLRRIEQGTANYRKHRACFSCHHQALPILSLTAARERGFAVSPETMQKIVDFSLQSFKKKDAIAKGQGIGGANTTVAYALTALAAAGHKPDDTTAALMDFLLVRQHKDGSWPAVANRPPSEGSAFTNAALGLLSLKRFSPSELPKASPKERIEASFRKGKEWLLANQPKTTEDKIFHLRGLVYADAEAQEIDSARDLLVREQTPDGSWAQLPDLAGDAYATGSALVALKISGLPADHPAFRKAVKFLVSTQKEDGSWLVTTRSRPIQVLFDNGDPGGPSQFISFAATNWAVLGLLASGAQAGREKVPTPINLGKVNSDADEDDPFILPDNKALLYTSNKSGNHGVLIAQRSGKGWAASKPIPELNSKECDFRSPFLARDGKLYFATNEVPDETLNDLKNFDIKFRNQGRAPLPLLGISEKEDELHPWLTPAGKEFYFSRKTKDGWLLMVAKGPNPGPIGDAKPVGFAPGFHHASLSNSGLVMYLQGPLGKDRIGIFRSKRNKLAAAWSDPETLVNLNSSDARRGDMSPCLNADGNRLYFASDRPEGKGGLDLWAVETANLKTR